MAKTLFFALAIICLGTAFKTFNNSEYILRKMHERFEGKWYKTFSFNQTTEVYRNDTLLRSETWYENIKFPGEFRIDFGNPDSGNAVIFKNDSSYLFRKSKLARVGQDKNDLLFLLGGMYFYPFDTVIAKMNSFGYDLSKFHEDTWNGEPVYVIGAGKDEISINQIWVKKKNYSPVRLLKYENNAKEEALFEKHVPLGGGFTETLVHFYINDKLIQVEKYHDLKDNLAIDDAIFDPNNFMQLNLK